MTNTARSPRADWRLSGLLFLCLVLFLCAAVSTIHLVGRLSQFFETDRRDEICLTADITESGELFSAADTRRTVHSVISAADQNNTEKTAETGDNAINNTNNNTNNNGKYGFEARDDKVIWQTETAVDIFHVTYDETGSVTVRSDNGDKMLAPGTGNSYQFRLSNTGQVPLDYTMKVTAFIEPEDVELPINARLSRHDGKWLLGETNDWKPVLQLDNLTDGETLRASSYAAYTLDWQWPFERGEDEADTALGNRAVDEDLKLTIRIETMAQADETSDGPGSGGDSDEPSDDEYIGIGGSGGDGINGGSNSGNRHPDVIDGFENDGIIYGYDHDYEHPDGQSNGYGHGAGGNGGNGNNSGNGGNNGGTGDDSDGFGIHASYTGDENDMWFYLGLAAVSAFGLLLLVTLLRGEYKDSRRK